MAKLVEVRDTWLLAVDGEPALPYLEREMAAWKGVRSVQLSDGELTVQGTIVPTWCVVLAVVLFPVGLLCLLNRQEWLLTVASDSDDDAPTAVVRGWLPDSRAAELPRLQLVVAPA